MRPNISKLSLKSLKDRLNAAVQTVVMPDSNGHLHHMVWIPRFRVPAGIFADGPSQDLKLGGCLVDKYLLSARYIQPGPTLHGVSQPFAIPLTNKTLAEYRALAAARDLNLDQASPPRVCHVLSDREWGHLAWLVRILGHDLHGNSAHGRDAAAPDLWEHYCETSQAGAGFGGTGPLAWSHNLLPGGIHDLLGHALHMVDSAYQWGCVLVARRAVLDDDEGISDQDTTFVVRDDAAQHQPAASFAGWPAEGGLIDLEGEDIVYGALTREVGTNRATLSECLRTNGVPHANGATVEHRQYHCILPGGYSAFVDGDGLDNASDPAIFEWSLGMFGYGTRDASPAPGDLVCCDDQVHEAEDLLVLQVEGSQMTVARGQNGTPVSPHCHGSALIKYPPSMTRAGVGRVTGWVTALRAGGLVEEIGLPASAAIAPPAAPLGFADLRLNTGLGPVPLLRGSYSAAFRHGRMFDLTTYPWGLFPVTFVGARCAWTPGDYQYGGL